MTSKSMIGTLAKQILPILPVALVMLGLILAKPWLVSTSRVLFDMAIVAAVVFSVSYATFLSIRWQRTLDEVQQAGAGFAAQWGLLAGMIVFALIMAVPPLRDLVITLVKEWAKVSPGDPGAAADRRVIHLAIMFGFAGVVVLQSIGAMVMSMIWWAAKR